MKKYTTVFFLWVFMISCKTNKEGFIEFRHVGECDKYIESIRIVKKEFPPAFITKDVMVDEKSFNLLFKHLTEGKKEEKCINSAHKFGSYQVTVSSDTSVNFCYIVDGRKQSLAFFRGVVDYVKKSNADKNLQLEINERIIERIDHPAPGFPESDPRMQNTK